MRLFPRRLRLSNRLHDLADAYALDALDDSERVRFERHLRGCPACADEVRRHTEVVTALAMAVAAEPHKLAAYLFEVASAFTGFYEHCPVLDAEPAVRDSRLALAALTLRVLDTGLDLLGVPVPERM